MKVQINLCDDLLLRQQTDRTKNWLSHSPENLMRTKRATVEYQLCFKQIRNLPVLHSTGFYCTPKRKENNGLGVRLE